MGKGSKAKAPAAPDPQKTAAAEAQFNRLDTYSPSGSGQRYGYTDANGTFRPGSPPAGQQSAVTNVESPYEKQIRETLQPASINLVNRLVGDNVNGMPAAPRLDTSFNPQQAYLDELGRAPAGADALRAAMTGAPRLSSFNGEAALRGEMGRAPTLSSFNGEQALRGELAGAPELGSFNAMEQIVAALGQPAPVATVKDRSDVARDLYNRSFSLMAPGIEKANTRLLTTLQARGIPIGGEAFNEAYGAQTREVGDTLSRLSMDANIAAGQEQSRQYGLDAAARAASLGEIGMAGNEQQRRLGMESGLFQQRVGTQQAIADQQARRLGLETGEQNQRVNLAQATADQQRQRLGLESGLFQQEFGNLQALTDEERAAQQQRVGLIGSASGARNNEFALQSNQRQNSIAEIIAALGGQFNPPSAVPNGSVQPINVSGLVGQQYGAQMAQYEQQQKNRSGVASTLGGLGSALISKSDRRVKRDIRKVGQRGRLNVYEFRYAFDLPGTVRRGYMAQEVLNVAPRAVGRIGTTLAVDYAQLPEVA